MLMKTFTGTSNDLAAALEAALAQIPLSQSPDKPVDWKLEKISGQRGGIAGSLISVTICIEGQFSFSSFQRTRPREVLGNHR